MTDDRRLQALLQALRLPRFETNVDKVRYRVGETYGTGWSNVPESDRRTLNTIIITEMTRNETKRQR